MTIIETFIQLRDDIKTWVTNNLVALNSKVDKLNNFSGDYNDLTNKPNVLDDASDSLNVTDPSGNIILKVDENGLATTNVEAKTMTLNGQSLANVVDEVETLNDLVGDTAVSTQIQNAINSQYHFSGDYNDLANKPDILDDGSDSFIIADNSGNVVLEVDENGLNTTALSVNGVNIQSTFDAKVDKVEGKGLSTEDFTTAEKNKLAGLDAALAQKSNVGHDHNDVYYTEAEIDSKMGTKSDVGHKHDDVYYTEAEIDSKLSPVTVHMGNENIHVTADDKAKWNNISNISDDGTGALNIADPSGNIIMSVDKSGLNTTDVLIKGVSIQSTIEQKADSTLASAKEYADDIKDDLLNGAGDAYDTLKELGELIDVNVDAIDALEKVAASKASSADLTAHTTNKSNPHAVTLVQLGVNASADELNKLDGVTATTAEINYLSGVTSKIQTQLNAKAELAALNDHVDDKVAHVTAAERKSWNEKSEFSGDYHDLTNAPDIKEDGSGNLVIADPSGNIIFRSDANGFETTTLTTKTLVVNGTDLGAVVANQEILIEGKVDKVDGKGLSSNDFTTAEKNKLAGIPDGGGIPIVEATSTNGQIYNASLPSFKKKNGFKITIIPNMDSTATTGLILNVNGVTSFANIFRKNETGSISTFNTSPLKKDVPYTLTYCEQGIFHWEIDRYEVPIASELSGIVSIANGGTGSDTVEGALENLGINDMEFITLDDIDEIAVDHSLATDSWETISKFSKYGMWNPYYSIGDTKDITLTTGEVVTLEIIGFNHDVLSNGTGNAGITFATKNLLDTKYNINSEDTSDGGWASCEMRARLQPNGEIYKTLPDEVKAVIRPVNKISKNYDSGALTTTSDYAFLLSYTEVFGLSGGDEGKYYDYGYEEYSGNYVNGFDTRKCLKYYNSGNVGAWFLRSSENYHSLGNWRAVEVNQLCNSHKANELLGVIFAFCV